jgi:hypothetical protein
MVHTQRMLVADKAVALSAALDTKQEILSQVVRGLNYDARTYAAVIRELERLLGGAEAEVMFASTELFKGPKVVLSSLDSVRTFRVKLFAYRTILETHGQREAEFADARQRNERDARIRAEEIWLERQVEQFFC